MDQAQVVQEDAQSPIVEPSQVQDNVQSPVFGKGFNFLAEKTFASGSSSAPSLLEHYVSSGKLAMILAFQDSISQSKGKGISIGSRQGSDEDSHQIIFELKQEIVSLSLEKENSIKYAKIYELQANLGGINDLLFDLKQHLYQKFGDDFQPLSSEGEKITASTSNPVNPSSQGVSERFVRPALDANLDTFLSSGPSAQERREKQARIEELKGKMKMWVVKRKSKRVEYYEKSVDFMSWTKIDLAELNRAPFHNPTNNYVAWDFKRFLKTQVKNKFEGMKIVSSFTRKAKYVIDPRTNKTLVNVMWPPTKKVKRIPVPKRVPEGSLDSM
ncbi:unnamed protein product [Lactuca saligna]|uniref:Uncharacterized protein n=1 Tax=Lactuca saligna TaxID=75948 RepID=A0AA35VCQ3_LACSI|nr:unnamed protein product [Lactuca saligna]